MPFLAFDRTPSDRGKKITSMPIANEFLAITTIKGRRWIKESYCNCWREIRASTRGSDSGQKSSESCAAKREDLWSIWKSISQRPVYCTYWLIDCIDWVSIRELCYIYSTLPVRIGRKLLCLCIQRVIQSCLAFLNSSMSFMLVHL